MEFIVKILSIEPVTYNVKQYRIEKPNDFHFVPGQATEVSINNPEWKEEKRPFTFTCLNNESYLEFVIKSYRDHNGVTNKLDQLTPGDELIIRDVWGAISYQGEGYFIAGGAGITPFIAVLRDLKKRNLLSGNKLFFSNKTKKDIILKDELKSMLGQNAVFTTTQEKTDEYEFHKIDKDFLQSYISNFKKHFYICGPDKLVSDLNHILVMLGAKPDTVIFEK
ncbi:MAG: FAD-binding oxidoreductase [Bacteroidota bacterium]|nr:FAD-binding oxidoreductase [Bacteroidota bacterium]